MENPEIDFPKAQARLHAAGQRTVTLLRSGLDGDAAIPGLSWTAAECAAHLVTATQAFVGYATGTPAPVAAPGELAAINERRISGLDERDPSRLAALLEQACGRFLEEARQRSGDQPVSWYQPEVAFDLASATGLLLGELLVHGLDIARSAGRSWPIERDDALLAVQGAMPLLTVYADPTATEHLEARFELRFRGGPRVGLAFAGGELGIEVPPAHPVDCRLSLDPTTYLLVAYGRQGKWSGILTGRLLAWGRKPWLGMRLGTLFRSP